MATEKPETARYISKYRNLTIAVKSSYYKVVEDKRVLVEGKRVIFTDGFFETNDEGLIAELDQRADFGTAFAKIPKNKSVDQAREALKTISEKDKEIAALKAENEALKLKAGEEGGGTGDVDTEDTDAPVAVSEDMKRAELAAVALEEGVTQEAIDEAPNKAALVELITENRAKGSKEGGSFEG